MLVTTKSIFQSKTFWMGVAVALLPLLEALLGLFEAIGVQWPAVVSGIGAAIVILRWATTQPVDLLGGGVKDVE